ncbi:MAG: acetyltransferase [Cyclobacteriaceae bacterium]|nr:acetyltransferase [Cyclobacteriaceae bacterium]
MKDIAVYGAGGFGRETAWLIQEINQAADTWNLVGFFDDGEKRGAVIEGLPVLGGMTELNATTETIDVVVAIADPATRKKVVTSITNRKISFPQVVHPTARLGSPSNKFGRGCIITAGVILTTGISVGEFSIINLATTVGHDSRLSDYCSVMPQCSISGNVLFGEEVFVGAGARILQGITLGEKSVIGAGAVVTKSFPASSRLIGVPAQHVPSAS